MARNTSTEHLSSHIRKYLQVHKLSLVGQGYCVDNGTSFTQLKLLHASENSWSQWVMCRPQTSIQEDKMHLEPLNRPMTVWWMDKWPVHEVWMCERECHMSCHLGVVYLWMKQTIFWLMQSLCSEDKGFSQWVDCFPSIDVDGNGTVTHHKYSRTCRFINCA